MQLESLLSPLSGDGVRVLVPIVVLAVLVIRLVVRARARSDDSDPILLAFPPERPSWQTRAEGDTRAPRARAPSVAPAAEWHEPESELEPPALPPPVATPAPAMIAPPVTPPAAVTAPPPEAVRPPATVPPAPAPARRRPMEESPTVRLDMTAGLPIEFLPGRLEILDGLPTDQEFRFHRVPGVSPAEMTLGRGAGPEYRHIQLPAPSVSRLHARLRFEDGQWTVQNLSEVNPLRLNGSLLAGPRPLVDGDELEVGEVVLRYRDNRR